MTNKVYKPGFFCCLFWVITWAGILSGIICLFWTTEKALPIMLVSWITAAVAAVISYFIRTVEKSSHDGFWSWHWFD